MGTPEGRPQWGVAFAEAKTAMVSLQQGSAAAGTPRVKPSVLRVYQLDGWSLEMAAQRILREQMGNATSLLDSRFISAIQDELNVLLSALVYYVSVAQHNQFYGDRLQNIVYRSDAAAKRSGHELLVRATASTVPSPRQKLLHAALLIGVPYLHAKLSTLALDEGWASAPRGSWRHRLNAWLPHAEVAYDGAHLLNLIVFLYQGTYRSVVDRLLGLRLVVGTQRMNQFLSMQYMHEQLSWSVVLNFLSFLMPLLRLGRVWRAFLNSTMSYAGSVASGSGSASSCALCGVDPIVAPRVASCGHRVCYYCGASRLAASGTYSCPRCGGSVSSVAQPTS